MSANWREQIPIVHAPRHPLWLDAYAGAWDLLLGQPAPAVRGEACLPALCLRFAGEAAADWLDRTDPADPRQAWCEWAYYEQRADRERLARVLPGLVEGFAARPAGAAGLAGTAHEAMAAECLARGAQALGDLALAERFRREWGARCRALAQAWNEPLGFYVENAAAPAKTSAGFLPLLAGAPSGGQAEALVQHLARQDEFWRVHVAPSLSADEPRYADRGAGRRGSVYPQDNYAIVKGLERYGQHDLALRMADNHITTLSHVFKETRALWDNYAPDYVEPGSIAHPDEPLAALSAIALLIETLFGLRVDAPAGVVHWQPRLRETHGVERLCAGRAVVAARVLERGDGWHAQFTTSEPLRLHLVDPRGEQWVDVRQAFESALA